MINMFLLQHREAIDQETKTSHTHSLFCIPYQTPRPYFSLLFSLSMEPLFFPSLSSSLGTWPYLSVCLWDEQYWTLSIFLSLERSSFMLILTAGDWQWNRAPVPFPTLPTTTTSNLRWSLTTASIQARAEDREEGALNRVFLKLLNTNISKKLLTETIIFPPRINAF